MIISWSIHYNVSLECFIRGGNPGLIIWWLMVMLTRHWASPFAVTHPITTHTKDGVRGAAPTSTTPSETVTWCGGAYRNQPLQLVRLLLPASSALGSPVPRKHPELGPRSRSATGPHHTGP